MRFDGVGLDERTRTMPCRVVVDDPLGVTVERELSEGERDNDAARGPRALVRGMFVTIQLETQPTGGILRVPEAALKPGNRLGMVTFAEEVVPVDVLNAAGEVTGQARSAIYRDVVARTIAPWEQVVDGKTERYWLVEVSDQKLLAEARIVVQSPRGLSDGRRVLVPIETPLAKQNEVSGQARASQTNDLGTRGEAPVK